MQASQVLTIFLLAISCNLDNVGVGIAYGARGIGIPLASNFLIALITAAGTGLCIVFGRQIFQFMPAEVGVLLGAVLLIGMGVWVIRQEFGERGRQGQEVYEVQAHRSRQGAGPEVMAAAAHPYLATSGSR